METRGSAVLPTIEERRALKGSYILEKIGRQLEYGLIGLLNGSASGHYCIYILFNKSRFQCVSKKENETFYAILGCNDGGKLLHYTLVFATRQKCPFLLNVRQKYITL